MTGVTPGNFSFWVQVQAKSRDRVLSQKNCGIPPKQDSVKAAFFVSFWRFSEQAYLRALLGECFLMWFKIEKATKYSPFEKKLVEFFMKMFCVFYSSKLGMKILHKQWIKILKNIRSKYIGTNNRRIQDKIVFDSGWFLWNFGEI